VDLAGRPGPVYDATRGMTTWPEQYNQKPNPVSATGPSFRFSTARDACRGIARDTTDRVVLFP
jgi:hypothetical protein